MSPLNERSKVCIAPFHVQSKVCIAPFQVQSKLKGVMQNLLRTWMGAMQTLCSILTLEVVTLSGSVGNTNTPVLAGPQCFYLKTKNKIIFTKAIHRCLENYKSSCGAQGICNLLYNYLAQPRPRVAVPYKTSGPEQGFYELEPT